MKITCALHGGREGRTNVTNLVGLSGESIESSTSAVAEKLRISVHDVDTVARVSASKDMYEWCAPKSYSFRRVECEAAAALLRLGRVRRVHGGDGSARRRTHLLQVAGAVELQAALFKPHYVY